MTHALLICNGDPPSRALVRRLARSCDLVVCADGGANTARRYGIRPDLVIGDLDSITGATRRAFSTVPLIHLSRQDNTDLEKSLDWLTSQKTSRVTIVGATGGRLDFTIGNLSVLTNYPETMAITLEGDGWRAMPVGRRKVLRARRGTTVSLLPFGRCTGITLHGLRYGLRNATMDVGRIGVSNVVEHSPFTVAVKSGSMLLIVLGR